MITSDFGVQIQTAADINSDGNDSWNKQLSEGEQF